MGVVNLSFFGRQIFRQPGEKALFVGLPDDYLKTTFESSYGLKSGSRTAPDIMPMLDQEGKELTPEAYSRFRSALAKLSWYAQTRQDIRAWIGLLATQQAKPTDCTETALKLRYLYEDQRVVLRIPAEIPPRDGQSHPMALTQEDRLVCFSDASHAPLKSTGRRDLKLRRFTAAEQRQLDLLLAKREQAKKSSGAAAKSSMTDASKRRCASEDDDPSSFDEGEWILEQITAMQAGAMDKGEVMVPLYLDEMIPTPKGLSFEDWCKTLVTMPKYKKEKISFSELYAMFYFSR
eukprot:s470_g25.t1